MAARAAASPTRRHRQTPSSPNVRLGSRNPPRRQPLGCMSGSVWPPAAIPTHPLSRRAKASPCRSKAAATRPKVIQKTGDPRVCARAPARAQPPDPPRISPPPPTGSPRPRQGHGARRSQLNPSGPPADRRRTRRRAHGSRKGQLLSPPSPPPWPLTNGIGRLITLAVSGHRRQPSSRSRKTIPWERDSGGRGLWLIKDTPTQRGPRAHRASTTLQPPPAVGHPSLR